MMSSANPVSQHESIANDSPPCGLNVPSPTSGTTTPLTEDLLPGSVALDGEHFAADPRFPAPSDNHAQHEQEQEPSRTRSSPHSIDAVIRQTLAPFLVPHRHNKRPFGLRLGEPMESSYWLVDCYDYAGPPPGSGAPKPLFVLHRETVEHEGPGSEWWIKTRSEEVALHSADAMAAYLINVWERVKTEEGRVVGGGDANMWYG